MLIAFEGTALNGSDFIAFYADEVMAVLHSIDFENRFMIVAKRSLRDQVIFNEDVQNPINR